MKARIIVDSTITVKAGTIIDLEDKDFKVLESLNRAELADKPMKKETAKKVEPKKETRKGKK